MDAEPEGSDEDAMDLDQPVKRRKRRGCPKIHKSPGRLLGVPDPAHWYCPRKGWHALAVPRLSSSHECPTYFNVIQLLITG